MHMKPGKRLFLNKRDFLLIFFLVCLGLFICRRALQGEMLLGLDSAGHYLKAKFLIEELIPLGRVDGWFPYWHLGFQLFQFYSPAFYLFVALIHFLSLGFIPVLQSFNLGVALSYVLISATVYVMMRAFKYSAEASFIAGFLALFAGSYYGSGVTGVFRMGLVSNAFGLMLMPLAIAVFYIAINSGEAKHVVMAGILLGLLALSHIFTALFTSVPVAICFFISSASRKEFRKKLLVLVEIFSISVLVSAWWLVPFILKFGEHGFIGLWSTIGLSDLITGFLNGSIFGSSAVTFLGVLGVIAALLRRRSEDIFVVLTIFVLSFFYMACLAMSSSVGNIFGSLQYVRVFPLLAVFMAVSAGVFFDTVFSFLKKAGRRERLARIALLFTVIAVVLFVNWNLFVNADIPLESDFSNAASVRAAAKYLEENTRKTDIIANEFNWGEWGEFGSAHILDQYIPLLAKRKVIGGNLPEASKSTFSILYVPETMNGKSIDSYNRLRSLGVNIVVTYSKKAGDSFEHSSWYKRVFKDSKVRIFRMRDTQAPVMLKGGELASYAEENEHVVFELNSRKDSVVTLPVNYYPNWSAKVNGKEAKVKSGHDNLLQVEVKPGYNRVELEFQRWWWERLLCWLSALSFLFFTVTLLLPRKAIRKARRIILYHSSK